MSVINTAIARGARLNRVDNAIQEVFSAEIYLSALPFMKFEQFVTRKNELGAQPGVTIRLPKFSNIAKGGRLQETRRIPLRGMAQTYTTMTVEEWGNGIAFSELLLQSSYYDTLATASILLGRDLYVVLEESLRDAVYSSSNIIRPNGKTSRTTLTSADIMTVEVIRDVTEMLEGNNTPRWENDYYIGFIHTHQAKSLRRDPEWINASNYSGMGGVFTGEIGRLDGNRFIVTTFVPNGANNQIDPYTGNYVDLGFDPTMEAGAYGNLVTIYSAVFFGEYSLGHAVSLPVEMRDNPTQDFGREHGIAWYGIWGNARLESRNIVKVETA